MTRITWNIVDVRSITALAIATILSLIFNPLHAQDFKKGYMQHHLAW